MFLFVALLIALVSNVNAHSYGATVCVIAETDMLGIMCTNPATQNPVQITSTSPAPGGSIVPGVKNTITVATTSPVIGYLFVLATESGVVAGVMEPQNADSKAVDICTSPNVNSVLTHTSATRTSTVTFSFTPPPSLAGNNLVLVATTVSSRSTADTTCVWSVSQVPLTISGSTSTTGMPTTTPSESTTSVPDNPTPTPSVTITPVNPVTPTPTPSPPSVGPTGYPNSLNLLPSLNLYWKTVNPGDTTVSFALSCACTGWFAVGFSQSGQMGDSEAVLASFSGTTASAESVRLPAQAVPSLGSNPNVVLTDISGENSGGITTVRFTRQISVGGYPLNTDQIVIGAYQYRDLTDLTQYHGPTTHTNPNSNKVQNFLTGKSSTAAGTFGIRDVHALIMFLCWGLFLPFGVLWARYTRGFPNMLWFKVHRIVQYGAFGLSIIGFIIGVSMTKIHFNSSYHGGLGLIITLLGFFQVLWAYFRPHVKAGDKPETIRVVWEWIHWTTGRLLVILAIPQIAAGITIIGYKPAVFTAYVIIAIVVLVGVVIKEIYNCCKPDPNITPCTGRKYHTEKI